MWKKVMVYNSIKIMLISYELFIVIFLKIKSSSLRLSTKNKFTEIPD